MFSLKFCELFNNTYFVEHLRTADFKIPVTGSLFNEVPNLTSWRLLTVLERDTSPSTSLWVLWKFQESFFAEHLLATTIFAWFCFFFSFCRSVRFATWNHFMRWSDDKLGEKNLSNRFSLCRHGNQVQAWLSSCGHICTNLEITNNWRKGRIGRTEKLI